MVFRRRFFVAGLICSISSNLAFNSRADEPNVAQADEKTESNSESGLQPATRPPLLLAPPGSVPVLKSPGTSGAAQQADEKPNGAGVSQAAKLTTETNGRDDIGLNDAKSIGLLEEGFAALFNKTSLEGWKIHEGRPEAWQRDGEMISCQGPGGGWLISEEQFSDFELRFEYLLQPGANSGVGIRCPETGNPTFTGIELQLLDDSAEKYADLRPDQYTGSIYYQAPPTEKAKLNPAGEWNTCEVRCAGDSLVVKINGEIVNDLSLTSPPKETNAAKFGKLAQRPPVGRLAFQSHSSGVSFKNVILKDLSSTTESGVRFVDLQPGEGEPVSDPREVTVHYVGQLVDGTRFSDTRDLGDPVTVPLNAVIDGWKFGIEGMKVGGRRRLIVPPEMAYGSQGVSNLIPPDATLVFEVELCGFVR